MGFITTKVKEAARFMLYFSPGSESIINRIDPTFHRNESCPFNPKISNYEAAKMCLYRNPHFDRTLSPVALYNYDEGENLRQCPYVDPYTTNSAWKTTKSSHSISTVLHISTDQSTDDTHCSKCCNYKVPFITYCW